MLSCITRTVCCNSNPENLIDAGKDVCRLAGETMDLCDNINDRGTVVRSFSSDETRALNDFQQDRGLTDAVTYQKLLQLIENNDKLKNTIQLATEMDDMALECIGKSREMTAAMEKGVESLPDPIQNEINQEDDDNDEETTKEAELLADVHKDIDDLEEYTNSIKRLNLFSLATTGTRAFDGLETKGALCRTIFDKVKDLSGSIARIMQAFMGGGCCAQVKTLVSEARSMVKCIRLGRIISKLADAGERLIKAFIGLLSAAGDKFKGLLNEFRAAKKIKNFVDNINPIPHAGNALNSAKNSILGSFGIS